MPKKKMDIESEASSLIRDVWSSSIDPQVFVTDRVAFRVKNLIKVLRKNYYGVFDQTTDPSTGRDKIWIPLTESVVEGVVKNIDLDSKDINIRSKKPESINVTSVVRSMVQEELDDMRFGELLDISERQLGIDGIFIWKTWEEKEDGEYCVKVSLVDPLNFAIDPTAECIQKSDVVERVIVTRNEFLKMKLPMNTDIVSYTRNPDRNFTEQKTDYTGGTDYVYLYEYWGYAPKYFITAKPEDDEQIKVRIVASSKDEKSYVIHLIEENKKEYNPYEECWYQKVHGRWYGRGIAEKVLMLQTWLNTIVNIRINRSYVSQLGLFKIKKGAGITPQMISKLSTTGAVLVDRMDDIQELALTEASMASYKDEEGVVNWSERVTNAFAVVTGEQLPSSTPATNAVLQNRNAMSGFTMVKEGIGMFLQRWMNRHVLPIISKNLTPKNVLRVTGDPEMIRALDEAAISSAAYKELERINSSGLIIENDPVAEIERVKDNLRRMGKDRFIPVNDKMDLTEYDCHVYITNEDMDKGVMISNLTALLPMVDDQYKKEIVNQIFDLSGLVPPRQKMTLSQENIGQNQGNSGVINSSGIPQPSVNPQQLVTNANVQV